MVCAELLYSPERTEIRAWIPLVTVFFWNTNGIMVGHGCSRHYSKHEQGLGMDALVTVFTWHERNYDALVTAFSSNEQNCGLGKHALITEFS